MPVDHYVPQTHLRQFYSPALNDQFYAMRKSDQRQFRTNARGVCGINEGSTNAYLINDRAIEDFLATVEPLYPTAVNDLRDGNINKDCLYSIAGFVASVATCAPAAIRVHAEPLRELVEVSATMLDEQGLLPPGPEVLGGGTVSDLIADGSIRVNIDERYPQAIGITQIVDRTARFGNSAWEILHNPHEDSPFFTSDFPTTIEQSSDPRVLNRVVPLAPDLAIRIRPDIRMAHDELDLSFRHFQYRHVSLSRSDVSNINRRIVQCAEETVLYRDDRQWVVPFIGRNSDYRIEAEVVTVPHGDTRFTHASQIIRKRTDGA